MMLLLKNLTGRGKLYVLILVLSFIFSFLIISFKYFPQTGIALSVSTFAILAFTLKKKKAKFDGLYFTFVLLFSLALIVRSSPLVIFMNLIVIAFFGLLMLAPDMSGKNSLIEQIYSAFAFLLRSIFAVKSDYYLEYGKNKKQPEKNTVLRTVLGIILTVIVMAAVLPLLSSANPIFQKIVQNVLNVINSSSFFKWLGNENIAIWVTRLIFFAISALFIPKFLTSMNKADTNHFPISTASKGIPLSIPKIFLTITIFVFFVTQMQLYFAGDASLAALGISQSQRTRDVFTQLSVVAGIILLLIYNDRGKDKMARIFNWILGISGVFLCLMAYKSVFEYINAWGLTSKRLYGLMFATWVLGIFILYFKNYAGKNLNAWFIQKSIIFTGIVLLLINIFNFDYLIYHVDTAKTGQGVDYNYLTRLSADSLSYKEQCDFLEETIAKDNFSEIYHSANPLTFLNKVRNLQKKYSNFDFRSFSLLEYLEYKQIESVDTGKLIKYYSDKINPMVIK